MKKITTLFFLSACAFGFSQSKAVQTPVGITPAPIFTTVSYEKPIAANSFDAFLPVAPHNVTKSTTPAAILNQRGIMSVTPYTDKAVFEAAYTGTFFTENFAGGPGAGQIVTCGAVVSSAGGGCFPAGELIDGFNITASNASDVVYIGAGAIGNTSTLLGANTFIESTILSFSPDGAYAVGMTLFASGVENTDLRVYDTAGNLIDTISVFNPADTENFVGLISDVAIGKIEMQAEADAGELFGNLEFGTDPLGGGGSSCNESNPSNGFENGYTSSLDTPQVIATDLTVAINENFSFEKATTNFIMPDGNTVLSADITIYADDFSGLPDASNVIATQNGVVPSSQTLLGDFPAASQYDVTEVVFDLAPVLLAGQASSTTTYWVSVYVTTSAGTGGPGFWETTTASIVGYPSAFSADAGATWQYATGADDLVYNFEGNCNPLSVANNTLGGFTYYPNPTNGALSLKSVNNIEKVTIFNLLGQKVMDANIGATTSELNISNLKTGTYLMQVTVDGQTGTFKVLKN